ncbi:CAAX prenyl protease 2 [Chlorella vulgaris]
MAMWGPWIFAALYYPGLQVAPLYLWHAQPRSQTIYQRLAVTSVAAACGAWVPTARRLIAGGGGTMALLAALGIRLSGLPTACVLPLVLIAVLFAGPLLVLAWSATSPSGSVDRLLWLHRTRLPPAMVCRNWIAAPVLEEFIYRACLISYLLAAGARVSTCIWLSPLLFGASHLHHYYDLTRFQGLSARAAIQFLAFQLSYTTVFGWLAAYLFIRTGHLVAAVLPHAFCNIVGPPEMPPAAWQRLRALAAAYVLGLIAFFCLLRPLTEPALYGNVDLAQGRWREVALRCTTGAAAPNASLTFGAYHTLALLKLSMNEQAAAELSKLKSQNDAASHADSTAPWALRILRSEVLWALGKRQAATDWLYQLLKWCNAQEGYSVAAATSGGDGQQQVQLGRLRRRDIALNLVSKLCQQRQFVPALSLLNQLLGADAADLQAWMAVCTVQALLGDVSAAQATLRHVEQLLAGSSGGAGAQDQAAQRHHHQQLLHRHRGTLHFLQRDFRGAAREFAAAQKLDPSDAVAINNHALALMYSGQLSDAVQELESGFRHVPAAMMQEGVVYNLGRMYDVASAASLSAKQQMAEWVAAAAPDDFDLACIKSLGEMLGEAASRDREQAALYRTGGHKLADVLQGLEGKGLVSFAYSGKSNGTKLVSIWSETLLQHGRQGQASAGATSQGAAGGEQDAQGAGVADGSLLPPGVELVTSKDQAEAVVQLLLEAEGGLGMACALDPAAGTVSTVQLYAPSVSDAAYLFRLSGLEPWVRHALMAQVADLTQHCGSLVLHNCSSACPALLSEYGVAFGLLQFISKLGTREAAGGVDPSIALAELLSLYQLPAGPQLPAAHGEEESEHAVECTGLEVWQLLQVRARIEQDLGPAASLRVEALSCVAAAQGAREPQEASGGRQWLERLLQLCAAQ